MTELQTPIWLDGNFDRKGSMQIETTPQDYGMSMGDVRVGSLPDECYEI